MRSEKIFVCLLIIICSCLLNGCAIYLKEIQGDMGPQGATGMAGVSGEAGTILLNTYTRTSAHGRNTIICPEILNEMGSTFVKVYYSTQQNPKIWRPVTDGGVDSAIFYAISWDLGNVYVCNAFEGDNLMVQVYTNN